MKTSFLKPLTRAAVGALTLAMASSTLQAGEFTYSIEGYAPPKGLAHWDDDDLWKDGDGIPYIPGSYPGATDTILGLNGIDGAVTQFYLNGNRSVARLEATDVTATRIYSGSVSAPAGQNTLTITEAFHMRAGGYYLRSQAGGKLTVTTPKLIFGDEEYPTPARLRLEIGTTNLDNGNVYFTSQETVFRGNLPRFYVNEKFDAANGYLSLGHVTFDTNTGFNSGVTLVANTTGTATTLYVASLHSTAASNEGRFQGSGTVIIDPTTSTAAAPPIANFGRAISGALRIEKTGNSLQIFSFDHPTSNESNVYTGGTAINGGVLAVRNTKGSGLGTGAVTVGAGGTLAGNGRIALGSGNAITVASGGRVAPGEDNRLLVAGEHESLAHQTLTLHKTALTMESGSSLTFRVSADGSSDQIALTDYQTGGLTLDGQITIDVSGELKTGQSYLLFTFSDSTGAAKSSGLTGGLVMGEGFDNYLATFHYDEADHGGIGTISMTVAAIPEPNAALLLLPAVAGAFFWQRRRRRG